LQVNEAKLIQANWPIVSGVHAFCTTRIGGVSQSPWDSFNLATHVNDNPDHVLQNRQQLQAQCHLPAEPTWLEQVHGNELVRLTSDNTKQSFKADAVFTTEKNIVCSVMTADCLPVLFSNKQASWVAAAHAGWKGIANGILKRVVESYISELNGSLSDLQVWIGPAIGGKVYQVGDDVRQAYLQQDSVLNQAFVKDQTAVGYYLLNNAQAARLQLTAFGLLDNQISIADYCTFTDSDLFFSYRRDGINTGRMASIIWLNN